MNLLTDPWMPMRHADGRVERLAFAQLGDPSLVALTAPRPDLLSAAYQVVIGALQSRFAPEDEDEWFEMLRNPPARAQLDKALAPVATAFELCSHDGPAFFQDRDLLAQEQPLPISDLLIDRGSDSNLHFNQALPNPAFCESCTALALAALQLNAPAGGRGTRTSVRGGGPMTTLLLPQDPEKSLWERLWLNVVPSSVLGFPELADPLSAYPWMAPTRTSDGESGRPTFPDVDCPLIHVLWSFSRRVRLELSDVSPGECDLCGNQAARRIRRYRTRHGGTNYDGPWVHPWTPYNINKKTGDLVAVKGHWGLHAFRRWVGLVLRSTADDEFPRAALIVRHHAAARGRIGTRLWCSGYSMDNAKARNWYESVLPVHEVPLARLAGVRIRITAVLDSATQGWELLQGAVKSACYPAGVPPKRLPDLEQEFWGRLQPAFERCLERVVRVPARDEPVDAESFPSDWAAAWLRDLRGQVMQMFDEADSAVPVVEQGMERRVRARAQLHSGVRKGSVRLRKMAVSGDRGADR